MMDKRDVEPEEDPEAEFKSRLIDLNTSLEELDSIPFHHVPHKMRREMAEHLQDPCKGGWQCLASDFGMSNTCIKGIPSRHVPEFDGLCAFFIFREYDKMPRNSVGGMFRKLAKNERYDILHEVIERDDYLPRILSDYKSCQEKSTTDSATSQDCRPSSPDIRLKNGVPPKSAAFVDWKVSGLSSLNLSITDHSQVSSSTNKHNISPQEQRTKHLKLDHQRLSLSSASESDRQDQVTVPCLSVKEDPEHTESRHAAITKPMLYVTYEKSSMCVAVAICKWLSANNMFDCRMDCSGDFDQKRVKKRFERAKYVIVCVTPEYKKEIAESSTSSIIANPPTATHLIYTLMMRSFHQDNAINRRFIALCCNKATVKDVPHFLLPKENLPNPLRIYTYPKDYKNLYYFLMDAKKVVDQHVKQKEKKTKK